MSYPYVYSPGLSEEIVSRIIRWGRNVLPYWIHGNAVVAPAAGAVLVSGVVPPGKAGYIYGFFISAGEANDFLISWVSGGANYSIRIIFPGSGSLHFVDIVPLNEGLPADGGTSIYISNVNVGGSGVVYQARLLVGVV